VLLVCCAGQPDDLAGAPALQGSSVPASQGCKVDGPRRAAGYSFSSHASSNVILAHDDMPVAAAIMTPDGIHEPTYREPQDH
jgi:hypothetical protein